jgi:hypothetical protein
MRSLLLPCIVIACMSSAVAQGPPAPALTADQIMARVAANQDAANALRTHFVYTQHAHVVSRTGKTVRCEETTDTRVTPTANGSQQQLLKLEGRLLARHHYLTYTSLPSGDLADKTIKDENDSFRVQEDSGELDRSLVENLRHNLLGKETSNSKDGSSSKDGIAAGLFPLTSKAANHYTYRLLGHEMRNGHDCFHIAFQPKPQDDEYDWKGDAWIDSVAYQPIIVRTRLDKDIPFAVRLLLGTSLPGLGFTVTYAPQSTGTTPADFDALWFPSTFGTEFKMHIFFFLNRTILLDARNLDFEKTHVSSQIVGGGDQVP